tara:strand:- start:1606 stop:2418 length:813 start_codon:yes stop_codon:yes gene_type:complete
MAQLKRTRVRPDTATVYARAGHIGTSLAEMLDRANQFNMSWWHDDFFGDEIMGSGATPGMYQIETGTDGAINIEDATATNGEVVLRASNGSGSDNERGGVAMGLNFRADQNPVMYARIKIDAITTAKVEVGWTDAVDDAGAVNDLGGNTFTASDAALWAFDTDDTAYWQFAAADSGTAITKIENENAPVAATYETLMVQLEQSSSTVAAARGLRFNADGILIEDTGFQAAAITANVDLTPWVFVQLRTGSIDRNVTMDMWGAYQRRTNSA